MDKKYLNRGAAISCMHGGQVHLGANEPNSLKLGNQEALTPSELVGAQIIGCSLQGSAPHCQQITSLIYGQTENLLMDGEPGLSEDTIAMTNIAALCSVDDPGSPDAELCLSGMGVSGARPKSEDTTALNDETTRHKNEGAEKGWLKLRIVEASTGARLQGITFDIQNNLGHSQTIASGSDGYIRIEGKGNFVVTSPYPRSDDIEPGILCNVKKTEKYRSNAAKNEKPIVFPLDKQQMWVAKIETYVVKDGDTIGGIAEQHGLDWKTLANFNWGSTMLARLDPIGLAGENESIDSSSALPPPAQKALIPSPWEKNNLRSGNVYTLFLDIVPGRYLRLNLDDGSVAAGAKYKITPADDSKPLVGEFSRFGETLLTGIVPGPFRWEVDLSWPESKQLAARAKEIVFLVREQHEMRWRENLRMRGEILRILLDSPQILRNVAEHYKTLCDDTLETTQGFIQDVYRLWKKDEKFIDVLSFVSLRANLEPPVRAKLGKATEHPQFRITTHPSWPVATVGYHRTFFLKATRDLENRTPQLRWIVVSDNLISGILT